MTNDDFARMLDAFTRSAETGDGARFAAHFTEDAVYHDYIYGAHRGRAEIAHMMEHLFHRDAGDDYRWENGQLAMNRLNLEQRFELEAMGQRILSSLADTDAATLEAARLMEDYSRRIAAIGRAAPG